MRATFEHGGTIIDIGNRIACDELDTSGKYASSPTCSGVAIGIYMQDMADAKSVRYLNGFIMQPSEARAMASAILSAAAEAQAVKSRLPSGV